MESFIKWQKLNTRPYLRTQ